MISSEKIILRAPEPEDVDFLYQLENDKKLWHVSQTFRPFSRFEMEQYVLMAEKDPYESHQVRLMICLKSGDTIGTVDLFEIDPYNKRAGVGIVIVEDYRERGFASEALKLVKSYCFDQLNLHQLYCNIEVDNTVSIELFKKAGFEVSGLKKDWNLKNSVWKDEYFLQLIK
jgi:diamine N-acetyltransferase